MYGQSIQLDLTSLDIATFQVKSTTWQNGFTNNAVIAVSPTILPDTLWVALNGFLNPVATVRLYVQGNGKIGSVDWIDPDGSQTGNRYIPLGSQHYRLAGGGKTLELLPSRLSINIGQTDLGKLALEAVPGTILDRQRNTQSFNLFPGEYHAVTGIDIKGEGNARLIAEVSATTGGWQNSLQWQYYESPQSWNALPPSYYSFRNNSTELNLIANTTIFYEQIDNASAYIPQLGQAYAASAAWRVFPGDYTLEIGRAAQIASKVFVRYDPLLRGWDASYTIWEDADQSQKDSSTIHNAGFVSFSQLRDSLKITGAVIDLDVSELDNQLIIAQAVPALATLGTRIRMKLFPGDYDISTTDNTIQLLMEISPDGQLSPSLLWKDDGLHAPTYQPLNNTTYTLDSNQLIITGEPYRVMLKYLKGQYMLMPALKPGVNRMGEGQEDTLNLLPGTYLFKMYSNAATSPDAELRFAIANQNKDILEPAESKDLTGNTTNTPGFTVIDPGVVTIKRRKISINQIIPRPSIFPTTVPFATTNYELDGGYYKIQSQRLWFKYEQRYNENDALNYRILDAQRQPVPMSFAPPLQHYGANWFQLYLANQSLTQGEYYILEITNDKGDVELLRFQY